MLIRRHLKQIGMLLAFSLIAASCSKVPENLAQGAVENTHNDPFEAWNRGVWTFNQRADKYSTRPLAIGYRAVTPSSLRLSLRNAFTNITEPWSLVNNLLQGDGGRAGTTLSRLVINSTLGIGGLFDPATDLGLRQAQEDFGQTLAVWGVDSGPFIMLPLLGPSSPRALVGRVAENLVDPVSLGLRQANIGIAQAGLTFGNLLTQREAVLDTFDAVLATSQDSYAAVRSAYQQNRIFQIYNGNPPIDDEFDPFSDDF